MNELDLHKLSKEELEQLLIDSTDSSAINDIIDIFNLNMKKKDVVRANALSELQDKISKQIEQRIDNKADEFSNKDLLDYFKTVQEFINKSATNTDTVKVPTIQINQQNNVALPNSLNKDSRDKVLDAVQAILKNYDNLEEDIE
jgi:hypothetical protein